MNRQIHQLLFILCLFACLNGSSQYILNGSAEKNSCNCYTLTKEITTQSGSVWNSNKINLNNSFDFWFNVYLGCSDAGADGIVFILQPISTSVGSTGEGMGFGGVSPSIGIALDTYQNTNLNDPSYDHISIQANGVINHNADLAGPVAISATSNNVEDCQWHKLRISWDASTKWLRAYFSGILRVEKQVDLVNTIFNNDPNVFWGFTGATGGAVNFQQFCTALDPIFTTNFSNNTSCEGNSIQFFNSSESFAPIASFNWSFGDGTFSTAQNPPPHVYALPGEYNVNLKITGQDGCQRDSTKKITIGSIPSADMQVFDTCFKQVPRLEFASSGVGVSHQWQVDGINAGNAQPILNNLSSGSHQLQLIATSNYNCGVPDTATASFIMKPLPVIDAVFSNGCVNELISFQGQTLAGTTVNEWHWNIDGKSFNDQNALHVFKDSGNYEVQLWAKGNNGCISDTLSKIIKLSKAIMVAADTTIIRNMPAQLNVVSNGNVEWTPAIGLSNPFVANPVAVLGNDQRYVIKGTTAEGCVGADSMLVKVFAGPAIYVPSAFTPNGDGKNELLLPVYVGIKELKQFAVFNRWGQQVFQTTNTRIGWNGEDAPGGTYVWVIRAVNYMDQPVLLKGAVTIIR